MEVEHKGYVVKREGENIVVSLPVLEYDHVVVEEAFRKYLRTHLGCCDNCKRPDGQAPYNECADCDCVNAWRSIEVFPTVYPDGPPPPPPGYDIKKIEHLQAIASRES